MPNAIQLLNATAQLGLAVFVQDKKQSATLIAQLNQLDASVALITPKLAKRIRFYTMQAAVTNCWFSTLRSYKPMAQEKLNAVYIGALTPFIDDAMDELGKTGADIVYELEHNNTKEFARARFLFRYLQAHTNASFYKACVEALDAQDASHAQMQIEPIAVEKLIDITLNKGGKATLLYRMVLQNNLLAGEADAVYKLGGLLQLINDAFDVYKDIQAGQQTIFTQANDILHISNLYSQQIAATKLAIMQLPYSPTCKAKLWAQIALVLSRGAICINQLLALQQQSNNVFTPLQYNRSQLICDMEKWGNITHAWKWAKTV